MWKEVVVVSFYMDLSRGKHFGEYQYEPELNIFQYKII
jgi:hypothetical protein